MEATSPEDYGQHVTVLVVEDEEVSRRALVQILRINGYPTQAVASAEGALAKIERGLEPEVALVDLDLPGMSGAELIEALRERDPPIHSILVTAADEDRVQQIMRGQSVDHIRKPIDLGELLAAIAIAAEPRPQ